MSNIRTGKIDFLLETNLHPQNEFGFDPETFEWYYFLDEVFDTGKANSINEIFNIFRKANEIKKNIPSNTI